MGLARWSLYLLNYWMDGGDSSGAGSWGTPVLLHQSVVQNAVYDVDIRFDLGVLRHQGMWLPRWPLKG